MNSRIVVFLMALCLVLIWYTPSPATVEWDVVRTLKTKEKPRDVAISAQGSWIFVLTDKGEVLVYSTDGALKGKLAVGESVDGIKAGPQEDILLLTSRADSTVQVVTLDFIQQFSDEGSPFKGPADAPVVIDVFTEFQ